jgi:hypothetical protein
MSANTLRTTFLRTIGGLDDPRRGDERSKQVWSEAGAVAQQAQFYAALILGALMAWMGDRHLLYWSIPVMWIAALGNVFTSLYLGRAGATIIPAGRRLATPRGLLTVLLIAFWAAGAALTIGGANTGFDFVWRFIAALAVVIIGSVLLAYRRARRDANSGNDLD